MISTPSYSFSVGDMTLNGEVFSGTCKHIAEDIANINSQLPEEMKLELNCVDHEKELFKPYTFSATLDSKFFSDESYCRIRIDRYTNQHDQIIDSSANHTFFEIGLKDTPVREIYSYPASDVLETYGIKLDSLGAMNGWLFSAMAYHSIKFATCN